MKEAYKDYQDDTKTALEQRFGKKTRSTDNSCISGGKRTAHAKRQQQRQRRLFNPRSEILEMQLRPKLLLMDS